MKKICRIFVDVANNNSAIGSAMYEVDTDLDGNVLAQRRVKDSERLWADDSSQRHDSFLMPSVIVYQDENGMPPEDCYGYDALDALQSADLVVKPCSDIKYRFFVEDMKHGENARDFKNLIGHLLSCVRCTQKDMPDAYELSISHPVVCGEKEQQFLKEMIADAWLEWFPRPLAKMDFVDEAECAFRFAMTDPGILHTAKKLIRAKKTIRVLLVDIGGSTMELSLYQLSLTDETVNVERLALLQANDEVSRGMGSCRVDNMIKANIMGMGILDVHMVSQINQNLLNLKYFTPLKESLNERLMQGKEARLDLLESIADYQAFQNKRIVSREQFETWCSGYTGEVTSQIEKLCQSIGWDADSLDLTVLTGGGCALYPVEKAIRQLVSPADPALAMAMRPSDVTGVIGAFVWELEGGFPEREAASLACVLGNMAEVPYISLNSGDGVGSMLSQSMADDDQKYVVSQLTDLEERKATARQWMWGYVAANFGIGAALPAGIDVPWLVGVETVMATHVAGIMYKGTDIETKDLMASIVGTLTIPLLGSMLGTELFKGAVQTLGTILAIPTGSASLWLSSAVGGVIAASMTLALGRTYMYVIECLITGKLRKSDLLNKNPEVLAHLKKVTKANFRQARKEARALKKENQK